MTQFFAQVLYFLGDGPRDRCHRRYTKKIARYERPVLIYNPTAGKLRRNPQRILQRSIDALARAGIMARPAPTSGPRDATQMTREAIAKGADLIVVLGGDGTINEVVNGMVHSNVPLGILPAGTANVLAMELGLGSRIGPAIRLLGGCVERRIAVGKACDHNGTPRYFLSMGGAGLDAEIVYDLSPSLKACAGKLAYWLSGFAHVRESVRQFEVRINGDVYRCGFALASRVRNYGGDLEIASGASLMRDDFEVVLFEGSNPLRYLCYMIGMGLKRLKAMPGVHAVYAGGVELRGDVHLQVDGEYAGRVPARLETVADALTLLIPPDYH